MYRRTHNLLTELVWCTTIRLRFNLK